MGSTLKIICSPQNDLLGVLKQSQNPYFLTNLKIMKYEIRNTLFLCIYLAVVSYFSNDNWYLITSSSVKGHHNIFSLKKITFLPGQNVRIYSKHFFWKQIDESCGLKKKMLRGSRELYLKESVVLSVKLDELLVSKIKKCSPKIEI